MKDKYFEIDINMIDSAGALLIVSILRLLFYDKLAYLTVEC